MPNINITVANKIATNMSPGEVIVCGNSDYTMTFAFDSEWTTEPERTARFMYCKNGRLLYQDVQFTGDKVEVPILSNIDYVMVGVYAGSLHTTTQVRVLCDRSILCGEPVPDAPWDDGTVYGALVVAVEELAVDEGGTGTFTVCLAAAPSKSQPVYLAVSDGTRLTVDPAVLTFTPDNWAVPQTVTATSTRDNDQADENITVTLTSRKVEAKQIAVSVTDNYYVPELVTDGLVLHFDYRGHQDDTSTTITDLASGVTAKNFDLFGKTKDGINGGDNISAYKYLTLQTTDDPFAAFLTAMKNGQGFTLESFGTVCQRFFYFGSKQLYEFGGGSYFGIGGMVVDSKTQAVCVLADGTSSSTTVTMNKNITVDGVSVNLGANNSFANGVPNGSNFLHVVTTYSPDGTIRRYFNGYGVDESTTIENFASWDYDTMFAASASHLPAMLGTNQLGAADGSRYLSSQRVYNRVLTEDEIKMNMAVEASKMGLTTF